MIEAKTYFEVVLSLRAKPQPSPKIYHGGDCGACALAGLMSLPDICSAYRLNQETTEITPFSHVTMRDALLSGKSKNLLDRVVDDFPSWPVYTHHQTWGNVSWKQPLEWASYITMAIDAGYYGIASINIDGNGPLIDTDHIVLICGVRQRVVPHETVKEAGTIINEILVSCSAKHPEGKWYEVENFLKHRGGFNCYLARPSKKEIIS